MAGTLTTQDYSAWLTPERLAVEESAWRESAIYRLYAAALLQAVQAEGCRSVLELGCGTGWVPTRLPGSLDYTGVDANAECLRLARAKSERVFLHADIRSLETKPRDMVCAFALLKHFALAEWPSIVARLLSFGRVGLFTMNVGESDVDDFEPGFPHTWVSPKTLRNAVEAAGHRIIATKALHTGELMVTTEATPCQM